MRRRLQPVNAQDAALAAWIAGNGPECNGADIAAAKEDPTPELWWKAAEGLRAAGLDGAAVAAYDQARAHALEASERAQILERAAELKILAGADAAAGIDLRVARRLRGMDLAERVPELEAEQGWVLSRANDPAAFRNALPDDHPLLHDPLRGWSGPVLGGVSAARFTGSSLDLSFVVVAEDGPVLLVSCDVTGDGDLRRRETAMAVVPLLDGIPSWAEALAYGQIAAIAQWAGAERAVIEPIASPLFRAWTEPLRDHALDVASCTVDLSKPLDVIRAQYRQTHRQQAAWGRAHMTIRNPRPAQSLWPEIAELYRFDHRVFQMQPDHLAQPEIQVFAGFMDEKMVSAVITADYGHTAYYAAGVRDPERKAPVTHALIDAAIAGAQSRGQALFDFGPLYLDQRFSAKLRGIAGFKKGFVPALTRRPWLVINI